MVDAEINAGDDSVKIPGRLVKDDSDEGISSSDEGIYEALPPV